MGYIEELRALVGSRPLIMVGANVIILDASNQALLQRRSDNGYWGTIGGHTELGETLEQTARREMQEEANLVAGKMNFLAMLSGTDFYYKYPNGDEVYNVICTYWTRNVSGSLKPDGKEGVELRYFALDDLPKNIGSGDQAAFKLIKEKQSRGEL